MKDKLYKYLQIMHNKQEKIKTKDYGENLNKKIYFKSNINEILKFKNDWKDWNN